MRTPLLQFAITATLFIISVPSCPRAESDAEAMEKIKQLSVWTYWETKDDFSDAKIGQAVVPIDMSQSIEAAKAGDLALATTIAKKAQLDGFNARALMVACTGGKSVSVVFKTGKYVQSDVGFSKLIYRVDSNPPHTIKATITTTADYGFMVTMSADAVDKKYPALNKESKAEISGMIKELSSGTHVIMDVGGVHETIYIEGGAAEIKKITDQCPFILN